ncbi:ketoacyl-ACP synthase III [Frateuria sp. Soil773]|uniref:3-oxoacyl-ACP synthase III family protein n=1 Tax=Frateuria sp. Soil773 TaxID=1736407 RepID=UPI000A59E211|nr:ketoacyl-ACP synthase III [Frateuria sp. Soil773]
MLAVDPPLVREAAARPEFGIRAIGNYLPSGRIDCEALARRLDVSDYTLRSKIGFDSLAQKSGDEDTSDMAVAAIRDLLDRVDVQPTEIDCLAVVTQNPDNFGIPQVSALVHGKLDWPETVAAFDISLGCSGYVYALAIVSGFLLAQNGRRGVLVTADPYSKIVDPEDRGTALIFGDAATATLIERGAPWRIGASDFGTAGSMSASLAVDGQRRFRMHGKDVARFCMRAIPRSIGRTLSKNGLSIDQIGMVVLHQGSRFIVDGIASELGATGKTPFSAVTIGNTSSSSIPLALSGLLDEADEQSTDTFVLSSFGVGMSWASTVIKRHRGDSPNDRATPLGGRL